MAVPIKFREIVGQHVVIAAGIGVPGAFAFGADVPFLLGGWGTGAVRIFQESQFEVDEHRIESAAGGVLAGISAYLVGAKLASKLFHLLPGPGTAAAIGVNVGLNSFFTYRFLRNLAKLCDKYDNEEFIWQSLSSVMSLLSPLGIGPDFHDMLACIKEVGTEVFS